MNTEKRLAACGSRLTAGLRAWERGSTGRLWFSQQVKRGFGRVPTTTALLLTALAALATAGCRRDMQQAPRLDPLEQSDFHADQRASRPLEAGTVARGFLREDKVFHTGKAGTALVADSPVPVTRALLLRGQERFDIYCAPCHGRTGEGNGMIVQRGLKQPPSFHAERLRAQADGYFFDVMTNGFGAMQDYSAQVSPADRWAVTAYIRALQYSRRVEAASLSDEDRARLEGKTGAASTGAPHGGSTTHE